MYKKMILKIIALAFLLSNVACTDSTANTEQLEDDAIIEGLPDGDFVVIAEGLAGYSHITTKRLAVLDNIEGYKKLYSELIPELPVSAMKEVDFSQYAVIFAALGEQGNQGPSISIKGVEAISDYLAEISVVTTRLGHNCPANASMSYPYSIVRIKKTVALSNLLFVESSEIIDCED